MPGALAAESWTSTATSGAPVGRFNHCAVWTGSRMIVWGGDSGNRTTLGSGGVYNPESRTWTATAFGNAPSAREVASAVWTGEKMIVWGGFQATGNITATVFNDGAIYDPETNTWAPVATSGAPSARYAHTAVWTGSRMIVWGGFAKEVSPNPVNFGAVNTGASYDPVLN
ncbi:MAG: Kelch repeat-containing protein, partial [Thermoanaerobaculia bacterium]